MNPGPFPPLIDLHTAGWLPARVQSVEAVACVNSEIIARAALDKMELADHVYSFPTWCDLNAARQP